MLRRVAVLLLGLAVIAAVVGTQAPTAVDAERGVSVTVVDDDEAYVGYEARSVTVTNTTTQTATATLVTVENRFPSSVEVTDVSVDTSSALHIDVLDDTGSITPGESASIRAEIRCDRTVDDSVPVSVTLEGEGVQATLDGATDTRRVSVDCAP